MHSFSGLRQTLVVSALRLATTPMHGSETPTSQHRAGHCGQAGGDHTTSPKVSEALPLSSAPPPTPHFDGVLAAPGRCNGHVCLHTRGLLPWVTRWHANKSMIRPSKTCQQTLGPRGKNKTRNNIKDSHVLHIQIASGLCAQTATARVGELRARTPRTSHSASLGVRTATVKVSTYPASAQTGLQRGFWPHPVCRGTGLLLLDLVSTARAILNYPRWYLYLYGAEN